MAEHRRNTDPLGAASSPGPSRRRGDVTAAVHAAEQLMDRVRLVDAGVLVGVFCGFDAQGRFLVRMAKGLPPVAALSVVGLRVEDEGDEVIVSLERGDPLRPVILGRALRTAADEALQPEVRPAEALPPERHPEAPAIAEPGNSPQSDEARHSPGLTTHGQTLVVDGQRVVLNGAKQVELRCGQASIVLTAAGKILIKGTYVMSRSSGANRIKGAFVDIN